MPIFFEKIMQNKLFRVLVLVLLYAIISILAISALSSVKDDLIVFSIWSSIYASLLFLVALKVTEVFHGSDSDELNKKLDSIDRKLTAIHCHQGKRKRRK